MPMNRTFFVLFLLAAACFSRGTAQEKLVLTLEQCEALALKNNQTIRDAELGLRISRAKGSQAAHAKILPKFDVRNIWGPSPRARGFVTESGVVVSPDTSTGLSDLRYFTEVELNLVQPLLTFGKLSGISEAAHFGVQAEQANVERKQEDVLLQVRQLYWALVLGKELLAVVEDAQKELTKAENKIEELLDEGSDEVTQVDLFKLQIFKYDVNKNHREAQAKIDLTKSALKAVLGVDEDADLEVATEYLDPVPVVLDSLTTYLAIALQNRPELHQLRAGVNARRALVTVSKSDYYPQFFLAGQIKYNFAKDRFDPKNPFVYNPTNFFRPGIVLGVNLNLNFWQTRDKVLLAQAEYQQLQHKEVMLAQGIRLEVEKAYSEARQAETNMHDSRKALKASDNWLRSVTMTWDIGVGEVKELIDAFKENGKMQAEHFQNIFKFNTALAKLSRAIGRDLYRN
ncbi:MAG: TolC family protein [Calditrichaeota bacterium]|nr:MAG: TolC family protein [Calditrichota bacterium]